MPELTRRELLHALLIAGPLATFADSRGEDPLPPNSARVATRSAIAGPASAGARERLLFDSGWRFHLGHADDPALDFNFGQHQRTYAKSGANTADAAMIKFDDSGWDTVDLPHDWAVTLPFVHALDAKPGSEAASIDDPDAAHGYKPLGRNYPATSVGWYRRTFEIPQADLGKRIHLDFDGVFRDSIVFCNGHIVARNQSGYCGFSVDLTDFLDYGMRNVIVVRADATLGEGWFYEGAGIYRHAWISKLDPLHVPSGGIYIRSELHDDSATVHVTTEVRNDGAAARGCEVQSTLLAPDGREAGRIASLIVAVAPGAIATVEQRFEIADPALWSVDTPQLYRLASSIRADKAVCDAVDTAFGIRRFEFDAQRGFLLNGEPVKLKGTCNHQDHAGVGAAIPDGLHEWRIERLKSMGANAYRSSHNPPTPELLDICDRVGMLVIDETRLMSSDTEGSSQLERMVRRDRNHASVMLWSLGNEEPQMVTERGARIVASMKRLVNRLDPSRPCTFAMDKGWGAGVTDVVDVIGFNYRTNQIDDFHARFPHKPILGSETGSTVATRGIYQRDDVNGYVRAYDRDHPWWATTAEAWWSHVATRPYIAGGFVWTGFDYRGEPTPFNRWPNVGSQFGIFDSCGFPKDNYWYYQAQWTREPVLHLFPHWNWGAVADGGSPTFIDVWCHTNLDRVELFVNDVSQGMQDVPPFGHVEWRVKYAPGAIEARGYRDGKQVLTSRRETTGAPAGISLQTDRNTVGANGEDVRVITVAIVDANGRTVPTADNEVRFAVRGPARLIGVGNGNPASHESDKGDARRAFNGLCMAILQATRQPGSIRLEASSAGLTSAMLNIEAISAVAARPSPDTTRPG